MEKGLVHFYLGEGKGKSTALFGLALRALGRGFKVLVIQVLKARETGEIIYLNRLNEANLRIIRINSSAKFSWEMTENEKNESKKEIKNELEKIKTIMNEYDLIIFDELLNAERIGFVDETEIIELIKLRKDTTEMAFSGRDTKDSLKIYADYISVITAEKHPYKKGIKARIGIEY